MTGGDLLVCLGTHRFNSLSVCQRCPKGRCQNDNWTARERCRRGAARTRAAPSERDPKLPMVPPAGTRPHSDRPRRRLRSYVEIVPLSCGAPRVVVGPGVQVAKIVREIAARDLRADAMPGLEHIAGGAPKSDRVFVHAVRLDAAQLLRIERSLVFRIAVAGPDHAVAEQGGIAV